MATFNIKAAQKAGMSDSDIQSFMQQNKLTPAKQNWFTEGDSGLKGAYNAVSNIANLPSYALGGSLRGAVGYDNTNPISGLFRGIKEKRSLFNTLPEMITDSGVQGFEPGSLGGTAVGLGAELATPGAFSLLAKGGKALGLFNKGSKATDTFEDVSKAKSKGLLSKLSKRAGLEADYAPTRGLGRNNTTEKMLNQIKKTGMTPEEFFDEFKLWNRDPEDVQKAIDLVDKRMGVIAKTNQSPANIQDVLKLFNDEIARLSPDAKESTAVKAQVDEIIRRKNNFIDKLKFNNGNLSATYEDIYNTASRAQKDVPSSAWGLDTVPSGKAKGAQSTASLARKYLSSQTGGESAKLGHSYSALIDMKKLARKAQTAKAGNQQLPLKSIMGAGAGGTVAGVPGAVGGYALNALAQSPTGIKAYSKGMRKTSEVLSKAPNFSKAFNKTQQAVNKIPQYVPKQVTRVSETAFRLPTATKKRNNYPSYY